MLASSVPFPMILSFEFPQPTTSVVTVSIWSTGTVNLRPYGCWNFRMLFEMVSLPPAPRSPMR